MSHIVAVNQIKLLNMYTYVSFECKHVLHWMYTYVYTECIHIECRHRYSGLYKVVVPQITIQKNKTMYITRGLPNGSMGYHYFGQLPYVSMCINLCYSCQKKAKLRSTFDLLSVLQRQQLLKLWFCSLACHQAWPWKILVVQWWYCWARQRTTEVHLVQAWFVGFHHDITCVLEETRDSN